MAQHLDGPVIVSQQGHVHQTVVSAESVWLGRTVPPLGPHAHEGLQQVQPAQVLGEGEQAPPVPDVNLIVGGQGVSGGIYIHDDNQQRIIDLNGATGVATFGTTHGAIGRIEILSGENGPRIHISGHDGRISFLDSELRTTLVIDANRGDVELLGADCAEDFDVAEAVAPGSVLCIDENGSLRQCRTAYDRRVVGIVSGAGGHRPALRLDRRHNDDANRVPLALMGKASCLVDAESASVELGDLLTTSATPGHAMKVSDPGKAFGAVLGKSLGTLRSGRGLVSVLVTLQ